MEFNKYYELSDRVHLAEGDMEDVNNPDTILQMTTSKRHGSVEEGLVCLNPDLGKDSFFRQVWWDLDDDKVLLSRVELGKFSELPEDIRSKFKTTEDFTVEENIQLVSDWLDKGKPEQSDFTEAIDELVGKDEFFAHLLGAVGFKTEDIYLIQVDAPDIVEKGGHMIIVNDTGEGVPVFGEKDLGETFSGIVVAMRTLEGVKKLG